MKANVIKDALELYLQGHADLDETARRLWEELRTQTPGLAVSFGDLPPEQRARGDALLAKLHEYMRHDSERRLEDARRAGKVVAHVRDPEDPPTRTA